MAHYIRNFILCFALTLSLVSGMFAADAPYSVLAKIKLPAPTDEAAIEYDRVLGEQGYSEELLPDYLRSDATKMLKVRDLEIFNWSLGRSPDESGILQKGVFNRLKNAGYSIVSASHNYPRYWHDGKWSDGFEATRHGRVLAGMWYRNDGYLVLFWGERVPQTTQRQRDDALIEAVRESDAAEVEKLLTIGASVEARDYDGVGVLHIASSTKNVSLVKLFLKRGANPNARDNFGNTPLLLATDADTTRVLLENKADPNIVNNDGNSALILAAERGDEASSRLLLEHGANPNLVNGNGGTALSGAAWAGATWPNNDPIQYPAIVKLLLAHGADPNLGIEDGWSAITLAAQDDQAGVVPLMIAASKDAGALLRATARHGQNKIVELILAQNTDINAVSAQGVTALMEATRSQQSQTVQLLLQRGADVTRRDRDGRNALMWACLPPLYALPPDSGSRLEANFAYIAAIVVAKGIDIEILDKSNLTVLAIATNSGHAVAVRQLLKMGADPNSATYAGNTPLHQAAARFGVSASERQLAIYGGFGDAKNYQQIIADLVKAGVNVNARNRAGQTALTLAAQHENRDAIVALKSAGATR